MTTPQIDEKFNMSKSSVENHLEQLGYVNNLDICVPEVKKIHLINCINTCDNLLKRKENDPFLKLIIICDEKWMVTTTLNEKGNEVNLINLVKQLQKQIFTKGKLSCQSVLCIQFGFQNLYC